MNSGKSPATRRRLVFISSTARAQRFPAFDCRRESARDADCGSTTCAATDMWFSPFVDWWLEWPISLVARSALPQLQPCGSARERRRTSCGLRFVGKTRWRLETQRHQQVLVAESIEHDDLRDRLREQRH